MLDAMRRFYALVMLVPLLSVSTSSASGAFVDVTVAVGMAKRRVHHRRAPARIIDRRWIVA